MATRKQTKTTKEAVELKRCECGCGVVVKRSFAVGHDQRHKGNLLRAFDGGSEDAGEELVQRGWRTAEELVRRQTAREDKAREKAAKAAEAKADKPAGKPKVSRGRREASEQTTRAA